MNINEAIEKLEKMKEAIETYYDGSFSVDVAEDEFVSNMEKDFDKALSILRGIEKVAGDEILQMNDAYNQSWDDRIAELLNKRIWGE